MGFLFKAFAAIVAADAIDRHARRPARNWYPDRAGERGVAALPIAPPGWYGDPTGQPMWRWWDGTRWTDRTAPQ